MSIQARGKAVCPHCGQAHTITIYKSINVGEDPSLRQAVMDGSLFIWECPHCGSRNLSRHETLYHDPQRKLMVWMTPPDGEVSKAQMQAISNHTKALGGYTLRLVGDMGDLIEKILINDAGLDDLVIELCKYVLKMELSSKAGDDAAKMAETPVHFFRLEDEESNRFLTFMLPVQGQMTKINIGYNVYEDCCGIVSRNPELVPEEGFCRVDASTIAGRIM